MFYLHYLCWLFVYGFVWLAFHIRRVFLKNFNYPRYPETFDFDKLSIFWRWLLVYFYSDYGFLGNLPLSDDDVNKIISFRRFVNFSFFSPINFHKFDLVKDNFIPYSYNEYKIFYRVFYLFNQKSSFLNFFLSRGNFFLKFILVKNYIFKRHYHLPIYGFFYEPYVTYPIYYRFADVNFLKKLVYGDFLIFVVLTLVKFFKKIYLVEHHPFINKVVFGKITNELKKPLPQCRNYDWKESLELLKYFNTCKKNLNIKLNRVYYKVWINFVFNFRGSGAYTIFLGNFLKNFTVRYDSLLINFCKHYWPVRFQNDTFTKFVDASINKNNLVFFLRKNKIFNKGRYSRNRQIYRTGVYMCLWINIIFVYFYIFSFYRFAFNFGFMWVGIGLFIISMTIGRSAKYRFYNFKNFLNEGWEFFKWSGFLGSSLFYSLPIFKNKNL